MTEPRTAQTASTYVLAHALQRVFRQAGQELVALSEASCVIRPGDRIAISGPSGSGKSTLLHLLAGLDEPTAGSLSWPALGERQSLRPAYVSIALQVPDLLPPLTAAENVALPLLLNQAAPEQAQAAALDILEKLDLAELAGQLPEELSGGQAQRVVLARALVTHPRLVLADEPTAQLDHPTARDFFDRLLAVLDDDSALVVATHDPSVAKRMELSWNMRQGILTGATRE